MSKVDRSDPLSQPTAVELSWTLRGIAADLNALATVVDDVEAKRWYLRRLAASVTWDDAARSRIEGHCECADELIEALAEALR